MRWCEHCGKRDKFPVWPWPNINQEHLLLKLFLRLVKWRTDSSPAWLLLNSALCQVWKHFQWFWLTIHLSWVIHSPVKRDVMPSFPRVFFYFKFIFNKDQCSVFKGNYLMSKKGKIFPVRKFEWRLRTIFCVNHLVQSTAALNEQDSCLWGNKNLPNNLHGLKFTHSCTCLSMGYCINSEKENVI